MLNCKQMPESSRYLAMLVSFLGLYYVKSLETVKSFFREYYLCHANMHCTEIYIERYVKVSKLIKCHNHL